MKLKHLIGAILGVGVAGYGVHWLSQHFHLTREELEEIRERIQIELNNYDGDLKKAGRLQNKLYAIDAKLSDIAWGDEPDGYPKSTKHGWYLSDDD